MIIISKDLKCILYPFYTELRKVLSYLRFQTVVSIVRHKNGRDVDDFTPHQAFTLLDTSGHIYFRSLVLPWNCK